MGALQDFALWTHRKLVKKSPQFTFNSPRHFIPWLLLILIAYGLLRGNGVLYAAFEPYGVALRPFFMTMEPIARRLSFQTFAHEYQSFSTQAIIFASIWLATFLGIAFFKGRFFCMHLCPVGAILELFSAKAAWKLQIDPATCVKCGKCEKICRASCVNSTDNFIDHRRCVLCFDCLHQCPTDAIAYRITAESVQLKEAEEKTIVRDSITSRRRFLKAFPAVVTGIAWILVEPAIRRNGQSYGMITMGSDKRHVALPPGAGSLNRLKSLCVGCGLCGSVCPSGVIQISTAVQGIVHPVLPMLNYGRGYCQYECRRCMVVCPTGALQLVPAEEKKQIRVGISHFIRGRCVIVRHGRPCGACAEHCPTGAISLQTVSQGRGRRARLPEPVIDESLCIGCGACETVCPARPRKAIYVEGLSIQERAQIPAASSGVSTPLKTKDFPF
jgi:formate hydrogenlyase subunit 6/NADH:ubiquinone oxidoreductase subunit I